MTIVRNWIVPQIEPRTGGTPPPLITTTALPNGTAGVAYSFTMSATSGVPPYTWRLAGVSPNTGNWLSINAATGTLSGTPTTGEVETVRVQVTDSVNAQTAPTAFSLSVSSLPALRVTTSSLPNAQVGSSYVGVTLAATGGQAPYTWVLTGAQPNWGRVWGTEGSSIPGGVFGAGVIPQMTETETLIFTVTDSLNNTASATLSLIVGVAGTIPGPILWPGTVGLTSVAFGIQPAAGQTPSAFNIYRNGVKVYNQAVTLGGRSHLPYIEDRPLANNTQYTWTATSIVNGLESSQSLPFTATTLAAGSAVPPAPPAPLTWIAAYALPTGTVWTCTNTSSAAVSGTGTLGNVGCSLNWAIHGNGTTNLGYSPGDVIVLTSGASYVTDLNGPGYSFPNKANPNNLWTYVVSDQDPGFNPSGTLRASSVVTTLGGGVTDYSGSGGNFVTSADAASMPVIVNQATNGNGITLQPGANFLRFVGIWVRSPLGGSGPLTFTAALSAGATSGTLSTGFTGTTGSYVVVFSDLTARNVTLTNGGTSVTWSPALVNNVTATAGWVLGTWGNNYCVQMPFLSGPPNSIFATPCESIYFDRCRFGNDPANLYAATNGFTFSTNGVYVYGNHILAQQCSFEGFCDFLQQTGTSPFYGLPNRESHGFFMQGGTNICARNCRIEAVSEAVFAGGNYVAQNVPITDVTIAYNFIWKNPLWFTTGAVGDFKNHVEFKQGFRINVHHNVCTNNSTGLQSPQNAHNLVFWANDNPGTQPWTSTTDVDVHENLVVHGGAGCYFSGSDGGDPGTNIGIAYASNARMRCQNNIFFLDPPTATINSVAHPWCMLIAYNVPDTIIDHNTVIINNANPNWQNQTSFVGLQNTQTNSIGQLYNSNDGHTPNGRQTYSDRITVTNNILDGTPTAFSGNALGHGITTFQTLFPAQASPTIANNLYIVDTISYTGNDFPGVTYAGVGFTNFTGNGTNNVPLPPAISNWFVTSIHNTSSTTGNALGATFT